MALYDDRVKDLNIVCKPLILHNFSLNNTKEAGAQSADDSVTDIHQVKTAQQHPTGHVNKLNELADPPQIQLINSEIVEPNRHLNHRFHFFLN